MAQVQSVQPSNPLEVVYLLFDPLTPIPIDIPNYTFSPALENYLGGYQIIAKGIKEGQWIINERGQIVKRNIRHKKNQTINIRYPLLIRCQKNKYPLSSINPLSKK